jgi:two-component system cell cycle sensor histidine kinase/response regulator CckA
VDRPRDDAIDISRILTASLDAISEGVQIIDFDWRYLYLNEAACRHGRRPRAELLGRRMSEVYPGIEETPMYRELEGCMQDRLPRRLGNEFHYPDGGQARFELRVQPCPEGIFVLSVDVSDRQRLEAQLRHAQKMEAVGQLAGGVAHDFNNLLTAMHGFGSFALETIGPDHVAAPDLHEVLAAVERATALTRQLLAFSRHRPVAPRVADVNALVWSMDRLLRRLLGENIEMVTRLSDEAWPTVIDAGAFEQVVVNLAVNARDAMPEGGRLTIETMNVTLDEPYANAHGGDIAAGEYVVIAVSDDGIGMDAPTQERIFDPFFTTKGAGSGTGLGLSTCYGIVRQAGGHIWVYSEPGQGSTFKIYLPRCRGSRAAAPPPPPAAMRGGAERILLVEDDDQVRQVVARALAQAGYSLLTARDPAEALALVAADGREIDLLVTDMTMPGGNGHELAQRLRARQPRLLALYISGYTETAISRRGTLPPGTAMLTKPFTPRALVHKVRQVLDAAPAA